MEGIFKQREEREIDGEGMGEKRASLVSLAPY